MSSVPVWVTAAADQRAAKIAETVGKMSESKRELMRTTRIMSMLTEPSTLDDYETWDVMCDNCRRVLAPGFEVRHISSEVDGLHITITVGACGECWSQP